MYKQIFENYLMQETLQIHLEYTRIPIASGWAVACDLMIGCQTINFCELDIQFS